MGLGVLDGHLGPLVGGDLDVPGGVLQALPGLGFGLQRPDLLLQVAGQAGLFFQGRLGLGQVFSQLLHFLAELLAGGCLLLGFGEAGFGLGADRLFPL